MKRIITILFLALLLAGCGGPTSGTVIGKHYEPAHTDLVFIPIQTGQVCTGSGTATSPRVCNPIMTPMPFQVYDDADWKLKLRNGDDTGWVSVSEGAYSEYEEGDHFGDPDSIREEKNTKKRQS